MPNPIGARKTLLKITQYVVNDDGTITQTPSAQFTVLQIGRASCRERVWR